MYPAPFAQSIAIFSPFKLKFFGKFLRKILIYSSVPFSSLLTLPKTLFIFKILKRSNLLWKIYFFKLKKDVKAFGFVNSKQYDEYPEYNSIRFQCLESECWDIFKEFTDKFYDSNGLQSLNHCPCCHHEFNYEDGIVNKKEFTPPKNIKELNKMSIPDALNWVKGRKLRVGK